jgi:fusaric acid resistance family protein
MRQNKTWSAVPDLDASCARRGASSAEMTEMNPAPASRMQRFTHAGRAFGREVLSMQSTPLPFARMSRTGLSIALGFIVLAAAGHLAAAVICALSLNQLIFVDQLGPIRERLRVLIAAACCYAAAGALGGLIGGAPFVLLAAIFAFASFAGLVHGSLPGVEMIPRNSLICLVVGSYLPALGGEAVLGVISGSILAVLGAYCEHKFRPNIYGASLAQARETIAYQHPSFGLVYGAAAVSGLVLGYVTGDVKPYWVTITTLVVMQPGRRANSLRAAQRFLGTITGVAVAYLLALVTVGSGMREILIACALAAPFLWPLAFARNYGLGVAVLSFWILSLLDLALPLEGNIVALFEARLADTAIGCALALIANLLAQEQEKKERQELEKQGKPAVSPDEEPL